ncbi:Uncharacterised protein [Escherichia coli]|nr:Uncharacterised protein [Escherichia coli]CAD5682898.1 Uncharacterised protein [Escherichia coli]
MQETLPVTTKLPAHWSEHSRVRYVWGLDLWVPLGSVIRFWVSLMENLGVFGYFPCRKEFRFRVCFVLKHNRFRYCFY